MASGLSRAEVAGNRAVSRRLESGTLAQGAQESTVKTVERMLRLAGFDPGVVDNKFTPRTTAALGKFQQSVGLPATGALDETTFGALKGVQQRVRNQDGFIGVGQSGVRVMRAEQRLQKLGYNTGAVDGVYDQDTAKAARAFFRDQKDIKDYSGTHLGTGGQKKLAQETAALNHAPEHRRVKPDREHRRLDAATATASQARRDDGTLGVREGDRGRAVKNIQAHLKAAGFDPKHVNGVFDERTTGALKAFQRKSGLPQSGQVDPGTWRKLRDARMEARTATSPSQGMGERSAAVLRTERLLKKAGLNPGRVDGLFDRNTQAAVRRFERKHHRPVNGRVDTKDLAALKRTVNNDVGPTTVTNGYNAGNPYKLRVARVEGKLVEEHVARAYKRMEAAARKDGVELNIVSGFRTMAEQKVLYQRWLNGTGNLAARPGFSNHQNGRALDLNVQTGGSDAVGVGAVYKWLARNGSKFGFRRIPAEAWHWEYQGKVGV